MKKVELELEARELVQVKFFIDNFMKSGVSLDVSDSYDIVEFSLKLEELLKPYNKVINEVRTNAYQRSSVSAIQYNKIFANFQLGKATDDEILIINEVTEFFKEKTESINLKKFNVSFPILDKSSIEKIKEAGGKIPDMQTIMFFMKYERLAENKTMSVSE